MASESVRVLVAYMKGYLGGFGAEHLLGSSLVHGPKLHCAL